MAREKKHRLNPDTKSSPFAGCSIIITAAVVMLFLIGFTIWSLFKVNKAITEFTQPEPVSPVVLDPNQHETAFVDLTRRLEGFQSDLGLEKTATLSLTPEEINLAISAYDAFKELRGTFAIKEITSEEVVAQIAYKLNGQPLGDGSPRYLNGFMHAVPRLDGSQILFDISRIESLKGSVPEQFVAHLSDHQITAPYLQDDALGPAMKRLTNISLEPGKLILTADPDITPPTHVPTEAEFEQAKKRALLIFGITIAVFILFVFVFLKKSKGKSNES